MKTLKAVSIVLALVVGSTSFAAPGKGGKVEAKVEKDKKDDKGKEAGKDSESRETGAGASAKHESSVADAGLKDSLIGMGVKKAQADQVATFVKAQQLDTLISNLEAVNSAKITSKSGKDLSAETAALSNDLLSTLSSIALNTKNSEVDAGSTSTVAFLKDEVSTMLGQIPSTPAFIEAGKLNSLMKEFAATKCSANCDAILVETSKRVLGTALDKEGKSQFEKLCLKK